jgi:hypothetical protein
VISEDFPYLTRTSYSATGLARTFIAFLDFFNYTYITVITNKEDFFYQEISDGLGYLDLFSDDKGKSFLP